MRGAPPRFAAPMAEEPEEDYDAEPRAPTEFALRSLFMQFVTIADGKLDEFLRAPLVSSASPVSPRSRRIHRSACRNQNRY